MSGQGITRRSMLALLAAGAAGGIAALVGRRFVTDSAAPVETAAGDAVTPAEPDGETITEPTTPVGRIGAAYLVLVPEEASRSELVALVPELDGVPAAEIEGRLPGLAPRIAEDFAAGDTVVIDGWVLTRTEGRAAALVALGA